MGRGSSKAGKRYPEELRRYSALWNPNLDSEYNKEMKEYKNSIGDSIMSEYDPNRFFYGEKDTAYLGIKDAVENLKDADERWLLSQYADTESVFTKYRKDKGYIKSKKAEQDYIDFYRKTVKEFRERYAAGVTDAGHGHTKLKDSKLGKYREKK